jgi:hypothetical protein
MSRAYARHRNLPGRSNGFFAGSRNSQSDPVVDIAQMWHFSFYDAEKVDIK